MLILDLGGGLQDTIAKSPHTFSRTSDVTDSDEMSRRVGDSRKRSVNVSNAGILLTGYFEDIEARTHHKEIDINTKRRRRAKKMGLVVGSSAFRDELGCFAGRSVPNVFAKGLDG